MHDKVMGGIGDPADAVSQRAAPRSARIWPGALAAGAVAFLAALGFCAGRPHPLGFLTGDGPYYGDEPYYAETAVSLAFDHDFDLRNQLIGGLALHGPQIALGPDGAWYPKHPILMPLFGVPFVLLFGVRGLLLLNQLVVAALAAGVFALARRHAGAAAAAGTLLLLAFGTFLHAYVYNLSADLFAAVWVVFGSLALFEDRPGKAGLSLGAAVLAKPLLAVILPIALATAWSQGRGRSAARFAAGVLPSVTAFLLLNLTFFGSPFITSYDRNVLLIRGVETMVSHRDQFDGNPIAGAAGQLFDRRHGLVPTAPVILLAIPGLVLLGRRRPREACFIAGCGVALLAVLSPYRYWNASRTGHRFLIPVILLLAAPLALACEAAAEGVRRRFPRLAARPARGAVLPSPPAPPLP